MANRVSPDDVSELEFFEPRAVRYTDHIVRVDYILRLYFVTGLLIALAALGYFGFSFLEIDLTYDQRFSLMVAGTSALISAMSAIMIFMKRSRSILRSETLDVAESRYDVVREWAKFEGISRRVLMARGVELNTRSPRMIINMLESHSFISIGLAQEINMALDVRNRVVHDIEPVPQALINQSGLILSEANRILYSILMESEDDKIDDA